MTLVLRWESNTGESLTFGREGGVTIQRGAAGLDSPPVTSVVDSRVATDGAVLVHSHRSTRPIFLPLHINEALISASDVVRLFSAGGTLVADRDGVERRLTQVIYKDGLEGEYSGATGGVQGLPFRKYPLSLVALDPWWYGEAETVVVDLDESPTPFDASIPFDAHIPFNGGGAMVLEIEGDAPASPRFVIVGAAERVVVGNGTVDWATADWMFVGFVTEVDTRPGSRGPHRGSDLVSGAAPQPVDWSLLTESSRLFDFPTGTMTLSYGATLPGADTTLTVSWESRWLTP